MSNEEKNRKRRESYWSNNDSEKDKKRKRYQDNIEHRREYDRVHNQKDKERRRERDKKRYQEKKELYSLRAKEYRKNNAEKLRAQAKAWRESNREKFREYNLKSEYGITLEQYNEMFESQKGCCFICETHESELKKSLHVDHCHTTGKVRGLLCVRCNNALGFFDDDPKLLASAIKYLSQ